MDITISGGTYGSQLTVLHLMRDQTGSAVNFKGRADSEVLTIFAGRSHLDTRHFCNSVRDDYTANAVCAPKSDSF